MSTTKLLMIPGTLCNRQLFKAQYEGLRANFRCITVSNSSADNLEQVAKNILRDHPGKFSLMGLSYGGIIAFEILRQAPERVLSLILLNTNYKTPSEQTTYNQQRFLGMAHLGQLKEVIADILIDAMLHPKNAQNETLRETIVSMGLEVGLSNFQQQIKAQLARPDSTKDLPNISCPTLVITGKEDLICPVSLHEDMARLIPSATLEIIEGCGHLSTMEKPDQVNQIIQKWYQKINQ